MSQCKYPALVLLWALLVLSHTGKAQQLAAASMTTAKDSLPNSSDCYCYVVSFDLINNNLFGVGVLSFLGDGTTAVAGDIYLQSKSASNGLYDRPTYGSVGSDINLGLRLFRFMALAGPSLFTIAKPTSNQTAPFQKTTELSWNGTLLYHYKSIGLGFTYCPLYGAGIKISCWFRG
jgi:hypothetical protein